MSLNNLVSTHINNLSTAQAKELQALLNKCGYQLDVDGIVGARTRKAFNDFKQKHQLTHPDLIGETTLTWLNRYANQTQGTIDNFRILIPSQKIDGRDFVVSIPTGWQQKALSQTDFKKLALEFNVSLASVRAVIEIESNGSGFLLNESSPARPKILFEGHIFYRETPKPVSQSRPDLSHRNWTRKFYKGGSAEWQRLIDAMKFDPIPALRSASWGLGQVMGFNHEVCGCDTVEQFVIEAHMGEYHQARHMFNFCRSQGLLGFLRNQQWEAFSHAYNGPSYKANNYHIKLANAFRKWS